MTKIFEKITMSNSVLLKRIVLLLLFTVLVSGLLSATIYFFVSEHIYAGIKADELLPIARAIASGAGGEYAIRSSIFEDSRNFGASLHIFDAGGNQLIVSAKPPKKEGDPYNEKTFVLPHEDFVKIAGGQELSTVRRVSGGGSFLVVGVPISSGGAVVFTKPISEIRETMSSLYTTLIISTIVSFLIMLVPAYFLVRRLVVPIRQITNVAAAMTNGDYNLRADENVKGEIGLLSKSMNHFAVESSRLEQTRRDYVANVSHELKTPIASIRAMGETLRDGMAKTPEKQQMFYHSIVRESMRLSRLVDDLLELSRLQSGYESIEKTRFDLREVLQNIEEGYGSLVKESGLDFVLNIDMSRPLAVFSNADRIEQILVILLDNAIKHSKEHSPVILGAKPYENGLCITLSNIGEEIPPEDLPFIFDRFYSVDKSHAASSGLGLSIAKEIIKSLGEKIWVTQAGQEITFLFTIGDKNDN